MNNKPKYVIELSSIQLQQRDELLKDISSHVIIGPRLLQSQGCPAASKVWICVRIMRTL